MKPGDPVTFHDHGGDMQHAIVTKVNDDASLDLHVFRTTHKGIELAPGTAPMTCSPLPEFGDVAEVAIAASLPAPLQRPTLTSIAPEALPVPGETTVTEPPRRRK